MRYYARSARRSRGRLGLAVRLVLCGLVWYGAERARAAAGEREVRDFTVLIDGHRSGVYQMTIERRADGSDVMTGQADVRVSYLVYTYKYNYRGTEVWKDGRLQRLESTSNDDGKRFAVSAVNEGEALRVRVNGQERRMRADVWTTTYWQLPDAKLRPPAVPLLDADTAREIQGTLRLVGGSRLNLAGRGRDYSHYRLTGEKPVNLWYDERSRLVRQESVDDGHRTVLELVSVRHP